MVVIRPLIPTIAYEISKMSVNAGDVNHSWLVQQLLKQVENEKTKCADSIRTSIEATTLFLPKFDLFIFNQFTIDIEFLKNYYCKMHFLEFANSIFQPPKF